MAGPSAFAGIRRRVQVNAITCPVACTPASVRPAAVDPDACPAADAAERRSNSPWTVRRPGWAWKPANSVPSYSTRARYRTGPPSRACFICPSTSTLDRRGGWLDELELDDGRLVAGPRADSMTRVYPELRSP